MSWIASRERLIVKPPQEKQDSTSLDVGEMLRIMVLHLPLKSIWCICRAFWFRHHNMCVHASQCNIKALVTSSYTFTGCIGTYIIVSNMEPVLMPGPACTPTLNIMRCHHGYCSYFSLSDRMSTYLSWFLLAVSQSYDTCWLSMQTPVLTAKQSWVPCLLFPYHTMLHNISISLKQLASI